MIKKITLFCLLTILGSLTMAYSEIVSKNVNIEKNASSYYLKTPHENNTLRTIKKDADNYYLKIIDKDNISLMIEVDSSIIDTLTEKEKTIFENLPWEGKKNDVLCLETSEDKLLNGLNRSEPFSFPIITFFIGTLIGVFFYKMLCIHRL